MRIKCGRHKMWLVADRACREPAPTFTIRGAHTAGVTVLSSHPTAEHVLASGSYDGAENAFFGAVVYKCFICIYVCLFIYKCLYIKTNILPRQARDNHRKRLRKKAALLNCAETIRLWDHRVLSTSYQVRKRHVSCPLFIQKCHHFTKTGSGQSSEKHSKKERDAFSCSRTAAGPHPS
jgi:hypothetical protein